jgi:hypothetical protein
MRKCFLCGSILRRRAEFCRYCTVRQPGAAQTDGIPAASAACGDVDPVPPAPVDTAPLEQAMAPPPRHHQDERHHVDLHVERAPRLETPPPAVYEIDPTPTHDDVPLPAALTPTAPQPPVAPPRTSTHRTGRRHRNGQNGHDVAAATGATGNGTRSNDPIASEVRSGSSNTSSNGSNGASSNGNGVHAPATEGKAQEIGRANGNGSSSENGDGGESGARPRSLRGFEHFPDAGDAPKVRWG